jgi:glycosyltransferase involved in cell wall biosynthesis
MDISIVIPAYNEEKYLAVCLKSVIESGAKVSEIIVVDNNSTDQTAAVARQFDGVRVVHEAVKGASSARHRGYLEATGDLIAYLDADTRMPAYWIERVQSRFDADKRLVSISGPYVYDELSSFTNFLIWLSWVLPSVPVYWCTGYMIWGGNVALRREALVAIGGFNTSIAFYGDEADLGRRLSRVGKVRFDLSLIMYSSPRRLLKEGVCVTGARYGLNLLSQIFFNKTIISGYTEVR